MFLEWFIYLFHGKVNDYIWKKSFPPISRYLLQFLRCFLNVVEKCWTCCVMLNRSQYKCAVFNIYIYICASSYRKLYCKSYVLLWFYYDDFIYIMFDSSSEFRKLLINVRIYVVEFLKIIFFFIKLYRVNLSLTLFRRKNYLLLIEYFSAIELIELF